MARVHGQAWGGMTLGIAQEEAVRDFVVETECEHMDAARIERLLDRMASDARYHVRAWQEPFVGHDAIRAELLRQAPLFSDGCYETVNVASVGQVVFSEHVDSVRIGGSAPPSIWWMSSRSTLTARSPVGAPTPTAERTRSRFDRTAGNRRLRRSPICRSVLPDAPVRRSYVLSRVLLPVLRAGQ